MLKIPLDTVFDFVHTVNIEKGKRMASMCGVNCGYCGRCDAVWESEPEFEPLPESAEELQLSEIDPEYDGPESLYDVLSVRELDMLADARAAGF